MKHLLLYFFIFLGSAISAQVIEPLAVQPLENNAKKIFLNSFTGIPVLQTTKAYMGMNPKDGSIMWTVERKGGTAAMEVLDGDSETRDFDEIPNSPLVFASGSLLNVTNGKVLIDGTKNELNILRTHYVLPEQEMLLLEIGGKGAIYLYGVDPFENVQKFGVKLRELSGLSQSMSENSAKAGAGDLQPQFNAAGNLLYPNGKYLGLIDLKSGNLKWNEKLNAGYIFTNEAGTRMVVAEKRGGLGGLVDVSGTGGSPKKFGKKIHLIDTDTGKGVWKKEQKMDGNVLYVTPYDGGFLVVHDEGMNIYSFDDPKGNTRWKKDYKEKGVSSVDMLPEGLMVYFKNKRMLVDPQNGEELWKKAEKLEKERNGFSWLSVNEPEVLQLGQHEVTINRNEISFGKGFSTRTYTFDQYLIDGDRIVGTNFLDEGVTRIGKLQYKVTALEFNNEKVASSSKQFGMKRGLEAFDKVADGYFFYNDRGFVLMDYNSADGFDERKSEYYPDPNAALRAFTNIAMASGSIAYAGKQTSNMVTGQNSVSQYERKMDNLNNANEAAYGFAGERKINGQIHDEFAFFFANDEGQGPTLFKVLKDTGEEVKKYRFDDDTPLYVIDYRYNRLYFQSHKKFKVYRLE